MRVAVLCVVLSFVALGYSQSPAPCTAPAEWTGQIFRRDRAKAFAETAKIYFDSKEQRIATFEKIKIDRSERDFYHEILVFKEHKRYSENLATGICLIYDLPEDFRPIHIPVNATFLGEFYLGTSSVLGDGILVESWAGTTSNPVGRYDILVTSNGCIPINDVFFDAENPQVVETFYYDIVEGITDPNVFIPPQGCTPAKK